MSPTVRPGTPTATGNLDSTDVDNPNDAWIAVSTVAPSTYGSYTFSAAGVWTYTLDNSNAAVQALNTGQTLTDTFTVTTVDGTPKVVSITINGTNDAAVITGTATGTVTEAGGVANGTAGTPTVTGNLDSTDVDNPSDSWTPVGTATVSTGGYGKYTLTAAGVWTYTLDNNNAMRSCKRLQRRSNADRYVHGQNNRQHHPAGDHHHQRCQ